MKFQRMVSPRKGQRDGASALLRAINGTDKVPAKATVRGGQVAMKAKIAKLVGDACESCKTQMPEASLLHLHHVIPVSQGGDNDPYNLVILCPNCHATAHWMLRTYDEPAKDRHALLEALRVRRAA